MTFMLPPTMSITRAEIVIVIMKNEKIAGLLSAEENAAKYRFVQRYYLLSNQCMDSI
jgi:hypothetical protein